MRSFTRSRSTTRAGSWRSFRKGREKSSPGLDLLLYRLNVSALAISASIIAVFFIALRRSISWTEMRWWTWGWVSNAAALTITFLFWYAQPRTSLHGLVFAAYMVAKAFYVWLLLRGAFELSGRP